VLSCINTASSSIPNVYVLQSKQFRKNYIAKCKSNSTMAMQTKT
jgi:hypothetical protein